jgi:hypothetical protein
LIEKSDRGPVFVDRVERACVLEEDGRGVRAARMRFKHSSKGTGREYSRRGRGERSREVIRRQEGSGQIKDRDLILTVNAVGRSPRAGGGRLG